MKVETNVLPKTEVRDGLLAYNGLQSEVFCGVGARELPPEQTSKRMAWVPQVNAVRDQNNYHRPKSEKRHPAQAATAGARGLAMGPRTRA